MIEPRTSPGRGGTRDAHQRLKDQERGGFSLVELIYVMAIVGIMSALAIPLLDYKKIRVNAALNELTTELMAAQRLAILRGHDLVVAFDVPDNRLRIHLDVNNDRSIQAGEEWSVLELPEGVTFGLPATASQLRDGEPPVTFQQHQDEDPAVTFHRNGSASEMGVIYITTMGADPEPKHARAMEVIRSTAKVRCWSHGTGTWRQTC